MRVGTLGVLEMKMELGRLVGRLVGTRSSRVGICRVMEGGVALVLEERA